MAPTARKLEEAKAAVADQYGSVEGVEGVGIGDGTVRVYVRSEGVRSRLPAVVKGVPLELVVTGPIVAK